MTPQQAFEMDREALKVCGIPYFPSFAGRKDVFPRAWNPGDSTCLVIHWQPDCETLLSEWHPHEDIAQAIRVAEAWRLASPGRCYEALSPGRTPFLRARCAGGPRDHFGVFEDEDKNLAAALLGAVLQAVSAEKQTRPTEANAEAACNPPPAR